MTHDANDPANTAAQGGPLKQPEPPSQEALTQHANEGDGPFGADMQHLLGGTRHDADTAHDGSPYSTGTQATSGESVTPQDPRSTINGHAGQEQASSDQDPSP
ncbi:hypothetical protein [Deinococcus sonorensis]|uniref:M-like protein n=2 Tax=Deinococcus sonorensis TaxID=309891 RepID=A0AAU7U682_9DEIO